MKIFDKAKDLQIEFEIPSMLTRLGFGGFSGILIGYLIILNFPALLIPEINILYYLLFCGLFGAAIFNPIPKFLFKFLFPNIAKRISYYEIVVRAYLERKYGIMSPETFNVIIEANQLNTYLPTSIPKEKKLEGFPLRSQNLLEKKDNYSSKLL